MTNSWNPVTQKRVGRACRGARGQSRAATALTPTALSGTDSSLAMVVIYLNTSIEGLHPVQESCSVLEKLNKTYVVFHPQARQWPFNAVLRARGDGRSGLSCRLGAAARPRTRSVRFLWTFLCTAHVRSSFYLKQTRLLFLPWYYCLCRIPGTIEQ